MILFEQSLHVLQMLKTIKDKYVGPIQFSISMKNDQFFNGTTSREKQYNQASINTLRHLQPKLTLLAIRDCVHWVFCIKEVIISEHVSTAEHLFYTIDCSL